MEHDRYERNKPLFVLGMITLLLSIILFAFVIYLLPALLWDWRYDVPEFVFIWREKLRTGYGITETAASGIFIVMVLIPAIVSGFISYMVSNKIDNQIHPMINDEPEQQESEVEATREDIRETLSFSMKLLLLLILVILVVWFAEWLIARPAIG